MMTQILIIEDDRSILRGLEQNLRFEGYEVITAVDGERGLQLALERAPDLIVLDIMLPKMNGYEICRQLRRDGNNVPIFMLTAKGEEMDKVLGLELGADDYVAKPFGVMELLARIKALLRRVQRTESELTKMQIGNIEIDFEAFTAFHAGEPLELTTREFALLRYLAKNAGRALSRQMILNQVWGIDYYGTPRTVDNFITRLRQKIEQNPEKPRHILTVRGIGYKFVY